MSTIFISHRSIDNTEAESLREWLAGQGHTELFLDFDPMDGIPAGVDWEQRLYRELRRCEALLVVLTPAWLESKWCSNELAIAREKGKAIFVVRVKPCATEHILPSLQEIDLTTDRTGGLSRLARGLKEQGLDPADAFTWNPHRPIYPGLASFDIDDAAIFFGRAEESVTAVESMRRLRLQPAGAAKLLLITGASGSGKSSLMRAGLLARLKNDPMSWIVTPAFRRGSDAVFELARALTFAYPPERRPSSFDSLVSRLRGQHCARELSAIAGELQLAWNRPRATVVLALDQAEDFVVDGVASNAAELIAILASALVTSEQDLMLVATIRSDELGSWQQHESVKAVPGRPELLFETFPLGPMPADRLSEIVRKPAGREGLVIDDGLVDALKRDTGTSDALPLLAYTLRRLHEAHVEARHITVQDYEAIGKLDGAIRTQAEAIIETSHLDTMALEALRDAFVPGLVQATEDGGFIKTRARLTSLPAEARPLLRRLCDEARLLVLDRDLDGQETVDIAHEALLRVWPLLRGWITDDAEKLHHFAALKRAASEWTARARSADFLIHRRERLREAEALVEPHRFAAQTNDDVRSYLATCRAAQNESVEREREIEQRERTAALELTRRRNMQIQTAVTASVVLLILTVVALSLWRQANASRNNAIKQTHEADEAAYLGRVGLGQLALLLSSQPDGAVEAVQRGLQAYSAHRASDNRMPPEAMEGLSAALMRIGTDFPLRGPGAGVGVAFSHDGSQVLTASADGMARRWDAHTGEVLQSFGEDIPKGLSGERLTSIQFSPDEKSVAAISMIGTVQIWDVMSGKRTVTFGGKQGLLYSMAFSPVDDGIVLGGYALEVGSPPKAYLASRHDDARMIPLLGHSGAVTQVGYSNDGSRVLTVSKDGSGRIWDARSGQQLAILRGHVGAISCGIFSPDGQRILTCSADQTVRIWSAAGLGTISATATFDVLRAKAMSPALSSRENESRLAASFSPDGERFVTYDGGNVCEVWGIRDRQTTVLLAREAMGGFRTAAFSSDGTVVFTFNADGKVRAWSSTTGEILHQFTPIDGSVEALVASPAAREERVLVGRFSGPAELLTLHGGDAVLTLRGSTASVGMAKRLSPGWKVNDEVASLIDVESAAFSPDGQRVATASRDGSLDIWDRKTSALVRSVVGPQGPGSLRFSADGKKLGVTLEGGGFLVLNVETGSVKTFETNSDARYRSLALSKDGTSIVLGGARLVDNRDTSQSRSSLPVITAGRVLGPPIAEVRDTSTGALLKILETPFRALVQSVDLDTERHTAVGAVADGNIVVWDTSSGRVQTLRFGHRGGAWSVRLSVDGQKVVSAGADGMAIIWDSPALVGSRPLEGHKNQVISAEFSSDGDRVVTSSWDASVRVWSVSDGALKGAYRMHRGTEAWYAQFSPDGSQLLSVGGDGAAHVYPSDMAGLYDVASRIIKFAGSLGVR